MVSVMKSLLLLTSRFILLVNKERKRNKRLKERAVANASSALVNMDKEGWNVTGAFVPVAESLPQQF